MSLHPEVAQALFYPDGVILVLSVFLFPFAQPPINNSYPPILCWQDWQVQNIQSQHEQSGEKRRLGGAGDPLNDQQQDGSKDVLQ